MIPGFHGVDLIIVLVLLAPILVGIFYWLRLRRRKP